MGNLAFVGDGRVARSAGRERGVVARSACLGQHWQVRKLAPDLLGPVGLELARAVEQLPGQPAMPAGSRYEFLFLPTLLQWQNQWHAPVLARCSLGRDSSPGACLLGSAARSGPAGNTRLWPLDNP